MSADKNNYQKLKKIFSRTNADISAINCSIPDKDSKNLYKNVANGERNILEKFSYSSFSKRSQFVDVLIKKINALI